MPMVVLRIITTILCLAFAGSAAAKNARRDIAYGKTWLRLVHYHERTFGGFKSFVDGSDFFLSPNGKFDPSAELNATIEAFKNDKLKIGALKQHPQCAFPARYLYLKSIYGNTFTDVPCKELSEWRDNLRAESMTMVFSAAYTGSPASMFGHTLLRFNKYPYRNKNPNSGDRLNSQAVSFAAEMKDIDAVRYAIYGLGGGFEGRFAISPYYLKVKEYALSENRDLWEYDLNLTQSQIFILTDHLWELYHVAKFDYYFLDENCAYILLAMLDATDESLNLTAKLGGLVTPADTIKALMSYKDLVKKVRHWPSDRKVLRQSISALTPDERILFNAVISHEADDMQDANAYVLDAVVNYQQFKKFANTGKLSARDNRLLKNALRERSRADNDDDRVVPPIDQSNRPDRGHDTRALKLSYVRAKQESSYELSGRLGYHDLMDSPVGFEPLNELKFLELGVRINSEDTESIAVSKFSLIDLVSLPPYHKYDWQFSWLVRSGYRDELAESRTFTTMAGGGLSFNLFTEKIVVYNLALAAVKDRFSASYDYSLGPTLLSGILTRFSPRHAIDLKLYRAFDYQIKRNMALDARTLFEFEEGLSILESWQIRQNIKWILKPGQEFRAQDQYEWSIGLQKYF